MKIILINDIIKHDNYKRYDFITKSIILLIEKENLNKYYKWFDYETFRKYLKLIISNNQNISDIEKYIKYCEYEQINSSNDVYMDNKICNFDYNSDKCKYSNSQKNKKFQYNNIGLINLGATCYINSIIQILYHINDFRESILYCDVNDEEHNVLNELYIIFNSLKFCKDKYYNPISFINNFDNENIDVNQQRDVHEFMLNLFDKIENRLKKTKNEDLIKYFFQITLMDKINFKYDCNHTKEHLCKLYTVEIDVKYHNNLIDSLSSYFKAELIEGDNSLICEKCKKNLHSLTKKI